jgi:hypothetical protein
MALYDEACRKLAEARSVDEVKDIRDKAVAMAAYARQAKNRDLEADAVEIRLRATRKLDQLRQAQKDTVGLNRGAAGGGKKASPRGVLVTPRDLRPTLASQGIDKNLAKQARALGALSDETFDVVVREARENISRLVRNTVRHVEIRQKRASYSLETPAAMLPSSPTAGRKIRVARNADKHQWMLAIGPNVSREKLLKDMEAAEETAAVRQLARAAALEAEAKALREKGKDTRVTSGTRSCRPRGGRCRSLRHMISKPTKRRTSNLRLCPSMKLPNGSWPHARAKTTDSSELGAASGVTAGSCPTDRRWPPMAEVGPAPARPIGWRNCFPICMTSRAQPRRRAGPRHDPRGIAHDLYRDAQTNDPADRRDTRLARRSQIRIATVRAQMRRGPRDQRCGFTRHSGASASHFDGGEKLKEAPTQLGASSMYRSWGDHERDAQKISRCNST